MKNRLTSVLLGLVLLGGAAGLVLVGDRQGWLGSVSTPEVVEDCPHGLPAAACPFCDATLIETMGFCIGHGVPEALCTRCNPAVIIAFKRTGDWCEGHDLPESQCTICNPGLLTSPRLMTPPSSPGPPAIQLIRTSEVPRRQRPPSVICQNENLRIQFLSAETARMTGLEYAQVESREVTQTLSCNAEITYDGNRHARLSSRAPGVISNVYKDLGQPVRAGDVLAEVDSAGLAAAKADYLQAQSAVALWEKTHAREQVLLESKVGTEGDALEAETKLAESRIALSRASQRLGNLGLSRGAIQRIESDGDTSSSLPLISPFDGVVVSRAAVIGEVVDTKATLFEVADTSRMWAMLDVYEDDLANVRVGQPVVTEASGLPGIPHGGRVKWVSTRVDDRTRTLKVRSEIANPEGLLRAGMFGKALISIRDNELALVAPQAALQWEGCCNIVFVRRSDTLFEPRKVRLGYETDRFVVIEHGVTAGEEVVTTGSFLLKTEILKGSIGAGCCEVAPGT